MNVICGEKLSWAELFFGDDVTLNEATSKGMTENATLTQCCMVTIMSAMLLFSARAKLSS